MQTYVERAVRQLSQVADLIAFRTLVELAADLHRFGRRQRPAVDALRERVTGKQLQHQQAASRRVFDVVNGADAWLVEGGQPPRLTIQVNKARRASWLTDWGNTLSATSRPSLVSRAR